MMENIDDVVFKAILENTNFSEIKITNSNIHLDESINIEMENRSFYFENCTFTGQRIDFFNYYESNKPYQSLQFINCEISNDLFVKNCKLYRIEFSNVIITSNHFHITTLNVRYLSISGSPDNRNKINSIMLKNLNSETEIADLDFRLNNIEAFNINSCVFNTISMNVNEIKRLQFDELVNSNYFQFWKNALIEVSNVRKSSINEFIGKGSIYGAELKFEQTIFKDTCRLEKVPSKLNSSISFNECTFEKSVYFDDSSFYQIKIEGAFFKDIVSFNSTTVHKIKFKSVHFDKVAFFNDFRIILKKFVDISTIRIIKNQLYKTENKIDYLNYNALEQNIILNDKNTNFTDKILLRLNRVSNNFGNNWLKGVFFTLIISICGFFILLLINSIIQDSNYKYIISFDNNIPKASFQEILGEWLKFAFSFDLRIYKNYESNGFLLLIFFFVKIFIGYGVYQTIAAFRKHSK